VFLEKVFYQGRFTGLPGTVQQHNLSFEKARFNFRFCNPWYHIHLFI